jgi:phosphonate transport system substrate-binding protein
VKLSSSRLAGFGAAALLLAGLAGCAGTASAGDTPAADAGTYASGDSGTLIFGVVPDTESTQNNWQPLEDYLALATGKKIQFFEAADYTALIEAAIADKVDVAAFSGFTYYNATKNGADITPISAVVTGTLTEPGYYSVAIANPDSGITTLEDFTGHNICFVSETSTSGYLFPSKALLDAGVDPAADVTPVFAGKHDASEEKVAAGSECDAGFAEDAVSDPAIAAGDVVEVARELVPGPPITIANQLPQDIKDLITQKLSDVSLEEMIDAGITVDDLEAAKAWMSALRPVDDKYYDGIRDLCTQLPSVESCQ